MNLTQVPVDAYLTDGTVVQLTSAIACGEEGTVFDFPLDASLCAKVYHRAPAAEQVNKLTLMVSNPPDDPMLKQTPPHRSIAWPQTLIFQDPARSRCIGFLMPKMDLMRFGRLNLFLDENELRQQFRGSFTWEHSLYIARNISSLVAMLHGDGCCIGDIAERNFYAAPTGQVILLDCDSFQITDPVSQTIFRCPVGTDAYTAPELQGKHFRTIDRSPHTDTFALAVLLFELLMKGTHPYAARGPGVDHAPSTKDKIGKGLFPYPHPHSGVEAPPYAPPYQLLPPHLRALFEQCFVQGHKLPHDRPSALEWLKAFDRVLDKTQFSFQTCTSDPSHRYLSHLMNCPWCAHSSGTGYSVGERSVSRVRLSTSTGTSITITMPSEMSSGLEADASAASKSGNATERLDREAMVILVSSILKGEISVAEAAQQYGLTEADVENRRENVLLGAEAALRTRQNDENASNDMQINKLKQKIADLVLENDKLREALKSYRPISSEGVVV